MQKLLGALLLPLAAVLLFYRAWFFGAFVLFVAFSLLFGWSFGNRYEVGFSSSSSEGEGGGDGGGAD